MRRFVVILMVVLFMLPVIRVAATCPQAYCLYVPFTEKAASVPAPTAAPSTPTASATSTSTATSTAVPTASATPTTIPTTTATTAPTATTMPTATATPTATAQVRIGWSTVAEAPLSRSEAQGVTVDGRLYVFGGYTDTSYTPVSRRADMYDPQSNSWTELPDMPMAITHAGVASDGANIYLAGGVVGSGAGDKVSATTAVWRYSISAGEWTSMPTLPEPRGAGGLALIGRTLHFFGGTGIDRYTSEDEHWQLSLDGGSEWTAAAPLPNARNHLASAVIDGTLYVLGGQHGHNETLVTQRAVHAYDPATDSWTERAQLPAGRSHMAVVVVGGQLYLLGGEEQHGVTEDEVFVYDPQADSWASATSLPEPRHSGVAAEIGGFVFYSGGSLERTSYKGTLAP